MTMETNSLKQEPAAEDSVPSQAEFVELLKQLGCSVTRATMPPVEFPPDYEYTD